jgi:hypothetical protein
VLGDKTPAFDEDIEVGDVEALMEFLSPFDLDGSREKNPELSVSRYGFIQKHLEIQDNDSPMIRTLKQVSLVELEVMEGIVAIEQCKSLVTFLKQSNLSNLLKWTAKQEVTTRWNSCLTMLESLACQWSEVILFL